jgi:hypothetical protein
MNLGGFSLKRLLGITRAKREVSREIGLPSPSRAGDASSVRPSSGCCSGARDTVCAMSTALPCDF